MAPVWENIGSNVGTGSAAEVAVVSRAPGSLTVVVNDAAGGYHLRARELTGETWTDWQDLGSALGKFNTVLSGQNGPAAIVTPDGGIDAFAVGIDGTIVSCRWDPRQQVWRGLRTLKKAPSGPSELISVCSWNGTALFMRGNNQPYYLPRATPTYSWRPLFDELHLGPVAVATPGERMDLFGVGTDDRLVHKWCIHGLNWQPKLKEWDDPGGTQLIERPTVVRVSSTDLHVFAPGHEAGEDVMTHHWRLNGSQWTFESPIPGAGINHLRAVTWGPNRIDLFARGEGSKGVYHRSWNAGQWSPPIDEAWEDLGGDFYPPRPPAVVSWGPNRLDVFIVAEADTDGNGDVWHCWWDGAQWMPSSS